MCKKKTIPWARKARVSMVPRRSPRPVHIGLSNGYSLYYSVPCIQAESMYIVMMSHSKLCATNDNGCFMCSIYLATGLKRRRVLCQSLSSKRYKKGTLLISL